MTLTIKYIFVISLLLAPKLTSAQDVWGVNSLVDTELGTKNIGDTVAGFVNVGLTFLGILATAGVIFGGLAMMTSAGDSDKHKKGQNGAVAGAIGLIIILVAFAISRFVLNSLRNETM